MNADVLAPVITALIGAYFAYLASRRQYQVELRRLDLERARLEAENARLRIETDQRRNQHTREEQEQRQKFAHELLKAVEEMRAWTTTTTALHLVNPRFLTKARPQLRELRRTIALSGSTEMKQCINDIYEVGQALVNTDSIDRRKELRRRLDELWHDLEKAIIEYSK